MHNFDTALFKKKTEIKLVQPFPLCRVNKLACINYNFGSLLPILLGLRRIVYLF